MLRPRLDEWPALLVACELVEHPVGEPRDRQLVLDHVRRKPATEFDVRACDLLKGGIDDHMIRRLPCQRLTLVNPAVPLLKHGDGMLRLHERPAVSSAARASLSELLLPVEAKTSSRVVVDEVDIPS
jgi:hypothetical protein